MDACFLRCVSVLFAGVLLTGSANAQSDVAEVVEPQVDFARDVKPIFKRHCYACHGPQRQDAGLRLDARSFAANGGNSGQPILAPQLEVNEIYQRIVSHDANYRMPRAMEPLSREEIQTITQWVLAGCPWPKEADQKREDESTSATIWTIIRSLKDYQIEIGIGLLFFLLVLLIEHLKSATINRQLAGENVSGFGARLTKLRPAHHVICALMVTCGIVSSLWYRSDQAWREAMAARDAEVDALSVRVARFDPNVKEVTQADIYGNPPKPFHPGHPARLQNVYYRGNCERNPRLNNLGNYRTATLKLRLVDALGEDVQIGDDVQGRRLFVRLEIERAPYTSDALFSDRLMRTVFATKFFDKLPTPENDDRVALREIEPGKKWALDYAVRLEKKPHSTAEGLVYVYKGPNDKMTSGRVHYGMQYALKIVDGRLHAGSEVWMNSLFWEPNLARPQPGKVPMTEWFNHYPIPVLTKANINDPRLIGIGDYVKEKNTEPDLPGPSAN